MCRFADRTGRLILLFSPGDQVRRGMAAGSPSRFLVSSSALSLYKHCIKTKRYKIVGLWMAYTQLIIPNAGIITPPGREAGRRTAIRR